VSRSEGYSDQLATNSHADTVKYFVDRDFEWRRARLEPPTTEEIDLTDRHSVFKGFSAVEKLTCVWSKCIRIHPRHTLVK
jgi:hypothetical protein